MQTIKLPIPPEDQDYEPFVRGDTFEGFSLQIEGGQVSRVRCQIRPDTNSSPVLSWDSEGEDANVTISQDGTEVLLADIGPETTKKIRAGRYYGDVEVTFADGTVDTILKTSTDVIEDYTK